MLLIPTSVFFLYLGGTILNVSYRLMRISELKVDFDTTRSKDTKNECMCMTRHHMGGLRSSWKWPTAVVMSVVSALRWGKSLESK